MNDFTKEELKTMLWHITTKTVIPVANHLAPKIQSMIENYCQHNSYNDYLGGAGTRECRDCGKIF